MAAHPLRSPLERAIVQMAQTYHDELERFCAASLYDRMGRGVLVHVFDGPVVMDDALDIEHHWTLWSAGQVVTIELSARVPHRTIETHQTRVGVACATCEKQERP